MKNAYLKILLACAAFGFLLGNPLHAQTQFNLVDGEPIHSQADMDALKTGDTVVMYCPTCQSTMMATYNSDPNSPGHLKWMQPGFEKACLKCGGKVKAEKVGDKVKLVCTTCKAPVFVTAFKTGPR